MISVVTNFFNNYIDGTLAIFDGFNDNVCIDYSTIGEVSGKEGVLKVLTISEPFDFRYNVISNVLEYKKEEYDVVIANVFHFLVKESKSYNVNSATSYIKGQVFPLIFGGKYKFYVKDGLIDKIYFDLDAQFGNTYWLKYALGYKPFEETVKETRKVKLDDSVKFIEKDDRSIIINTISKLLLIADSVQPELVNDCATSNSKYVYKNSTYSGNMNKEKEADLTKSKTMKEFIETNKEEKQQNHHSYKMSALEINGCKAKATLIIFDPTKLGFKHFYLNTIYQLYFDEQWNVDLIKTDDGWKVETINKKPISKFEQLGYKTIEIQTSDLWS